MSDIKSISTSEFTAFVNAALDKTEFDYNLSYAIMGLCSIVVIFHFSRILIDNVLSGGEPFSFSQLKKPAFMIIVIIGWTPLDTFVRELVTLSMQEYVYSNSKKIEKSNDKVFELALKEKQKIDDYYNSVYTKMYDEGDVLDKVSLSMSNLPRTVTLSLYSGFYKFLSLFDYFIFACFGVVTAIWLKIVGLGGPIALAVSLLSGGYTVLINWAKTFLSVSLWLPVAGLVLGLVNSIAVDVVTYTIEQNLHTSNSLNSQLSYSFMISLFLYLIVISILFVIAKLLLLSKVPNMITGWIGGGSSAGGGLAAAYIPISIAKNVASGGGAAAKKMSKGLNAN